MQPFTAFLSFFSLVRTYFGIPAFAALSLLLTLVSFSVDAQTTSQGFLTLRGKVVKNGQKMEGVAIRVEKDGTEIERQLTDNKGRFQFNLHYDGDHKVFFSLPGHVDLQLEVITSEVPKEDWNIQPIYNISEVALFEPNIPFLNIESFKKPFARIIYFPKDRGFIDDENYQIEFQKNLFIDPTDKAIAASDRIVEQKALPKREPKEFTPISGSFTQARDGSPLQFKVVHLIDSEGNVLESTVTNENGSFTFINLPAEEHFMLQVATEDGSVPPDTDYFLKNRHGTRVDRIRSSAPGNLEISFDNKRQNEVNLLRLTNEELSLQISGRLLTADKREPVPNAMLTLVDSEGTEMLSSTDLNGLFSFVNLVLNKKLMLSGSKELARYGKLVVVDAKGKVIKEIIPTTDGFQFELLPSDQVQLGSIEVQDDGEVISGAFLLGEAPSNPLAFRQVHLVDPDGVVIETVTTNEFGSFVFTKLPSDNNYLIRLDLEESEYNQPLLLADHHHRPIKRMTTGTTGTLKFQLQDPKDNLVRLLIVDRSEVRMDISGQLRSGHGDKAPLANLPLHLSDGKGNRFSTTTDTDGMFTFADLLPGRNYSVSIDEKDISFLKVKTLIIADEQGNTLRKVQVEQNKDFDYTFLPGDQHQLSQFYVEDPWVDLASSSGGPGKDMVIREKIYFPVNDFNLPLDTKIMLDKVVEVMRMNPELVLELSAHTDSRGNDQYNLSLSQKRAQAARNYIASRGIGQQRIQYAGYGETQLVNRCQNGIDCSEEEHAENRRVEFKVLAN